MAKKKPTTKTKKMHPGGSVPTQTTVGQLNPLNRKPLRAYDPKIDKVDVAVPGGMKGFKKRQKRVPSTNLVAADPAPKQRRNFAGQMKVVTDNNLIAPAPSPTQSPATFQKEPGALIPGPSQRPQPQNPSRKEIAAIRRRQRRNASPFMRNIMRQQRRLNRLQRQNPSMPTAGVSQGRPVRGITPMPGPAPDAARMRRMQRLMRQQQRRFNQQNRRRARPMTPTAGSQRPQRRLMAMDTFRRRQQRPPSQLINRISNRPRRRPRVEPA